jgi:hypothetical protein
MNILEIQNSLSTLPQQIRDSANSFVEAKQKVEIAKLRYEVTVSQGMLKSQRANATLQKAEAIIYSKEEKKALFEAELEEAKLKNEFDYLSNSFIATRKLASLYEIETKNIGNQGF